MIADDTVVTILPPTELTPVDITPDLQIVSPEDIVTIAQVFS
jgi:hypothetical protein